MGPTYTPRGRYTRSVRRRGTGTRKNVPKKRQVKYATGSLRRAQLQRNQRRRITNVINSLAETKYSPLTSYDESPSYSIQLASKASMYGFVLGDKPASWTSDFVPLAGIALQKGDTNTERIGDYVNLQKTHFSLNIDMKWDNIVLPPMEFRIIHFRQRRQALPAGINPDPGVSLFLTTSGQQFGHNTDDINGTDLMLQPLNKRKWIIYRDQKMILQKPSKGQPAGDATGTPSTLIPVLQSYGYKSCYSTVFNFNFKKKAKYTAANVPENVPYHHGVVIYCRPLDKDQQTAGAWEVNTRGTTTFVDF